MFGRDDGMEGDTNEQTKTPGPQQLCFNHNKIRTKIL